MAWHLRHPRPLRRHPQMLRHAPRRSMSSKWHCGTLGRLQRHLTHHPRRRHLRGQRRPSRPPRRVPRRHLLPARTPCFAGSSGRFCRPVLAARTERRPWVSSRSSSSPCPTALTPAPRPCSCSCPHPERLFLARPLYLLATCAPRPALEGAPRGGEGKVQNGLNVPPCVGPRGDAHLGSSVGTVPTSGTHH